jgi:thioredoxin reductase
MVTRAMFDAVIIGAGPAGLSAALVLGRCRREVLIIDAGRPRNGVSQGLRGYLTRDGVLPLELRRLGREEVAKYPSVQHIDDTVVDAQPFEGGFQIITQNGGLKRSRLLLLATGRDDPLPVKPGFVQFYGRGVYHCPYCDGWEHRDQPLAVFGNGERAVDIALELLTWSGMSRFARMARPLGIPSAAKSWAGTE